jgi:1-acyl-sn-glycerol-3-phosphate acyltransferase
VLQVIFFTLFVRPFFALFIGLRVRGREHLPARDPFILVANHTSHLDAASLMNLFPLARIPRLRPVAAADHFGGGGFFTWFTSAFMHILPVARRGITRETNPIPVLVEALGRGESLIFFPEGTRHSDEQTGAFHMGIAHLVEKVPGVPVVPARLVNMGRSLPKGAFIPVPFFCEVRLGAPIRPGGSRREIVAAIEAAVKALGESI